MKYVEGFEI